VNLERRSAVELQAAGTNSSPSLQGYAAVFDSKSQDLGGFREIIRRGAFKRSLGSNEIDPLALHSHLPHIVLGRKSAGTLYLAEDERGLKFKIDLADTQTARELRVAVERGDIRGASFGFNTPPGGDSWNVVGGEAIRELRDVTLFEISVTPAPAYTDTSVAVRAFNARYSPPPGLRAAKLYLETV
jgi:hypothetical protein